jgi:hypothetical protein
MLCYRGLHDESSSKLHEDFYTRFKADESAQAVTGAFRLLNPDDNRERQPIHEHPSSWTRANLEAASGARYAPAPTPGPLNANAGATRPLRPRGKKPSGSTSGASVAGRAAPAAPADAKPGSAVRAPAARTDSQPGHADRAP